MKRLIYTIICVFASMFIPMQVFALGNVDVNKTMLTIEQGTSATFNITATNAASQLTFSSSNSSVISLANMPDWVENETISIKVNGLKVGTSTISINVNAATFDEEVIQKTIKVNVNVVAPKSSNANLSNIKIDGTQLTNFNASTTAYTLKNTDASSITISANASDGKASISGTGTKNLSYGLNTFNIVVTAENGSKKTYTLKITKNDYRSSENSLESLTLSSGEIKFDPNKTTYNVVVDNTLTEIKIDAKAKDSKAKISGTGTIKLKDSTTEIKVVVTAENGSTKTYTLNVVKKDKSSLSSNNNLKSLVVDGYNINFDSSKAMYYLDVTSDVDKINVEAISEDEKANVSINNPDTLKSGENTITIDVTAENGDVKTYKIIVNREDDMTDKEETGHSCIYKTVSIIEFVVVILLIVSMVVFNVLSKKKNKRK